MCSGKLSETSLKVRTCYWGNIWLIGFTVCSVQETFSFGECILFRCRLRCISTFCICHLCLFVVSKQSTGVKDTVCGIQSKQTRPVSIFCCICIFFLCLCNFCSGVFLLYLCVCSRSRQRGEDKGGGIQGKQTRTVSTFLGFDITYGDSKIKSIMQ